MRKIRISIARIKEAKAAHDYLRKKLGCEWYTGSNLDALHDALTSITEDTEIVLARRGAAAKGEFAEYRKKVIEVFEDSAAENSHIKLR